MQVEQPSVTLPTPELPKPPPLPEPTPEPEATPEQKPEQAPPPEFNPPTAESLDLPSSRPAGNPRFAPASVGMPDMKLDQSLPGGVASGSGALGEVFDWAKKLRFQAAVRGGYDSNVFSQPSSSPLLQSSTFANLNGGVSYRFGTPRLNFNANLLGGLTRYQDLSGSNQTQGTYGLGVAVEYRYAPRLVMTFNSSTSYQQQPNPALAGTANNIDTGYYYTANSMAANYQWSDTFTTVSRFNFTGAYYTDVNQNNFAGFTQPGFTQSFRLLVRPTTTAVIDCNTDSYDYVQPGIDSWGQSIAGGFDHIFNPKWFWNFRGGVQFRAYENSIRGSGTFIGPYLDNNLSCQFAQSSSISWMAHAGTQPSGQLGVSFSPALRTGLNYSQGIFTRMKMNIGFFYLLQYFNDSLNGPGGTLIDYSQTNVQGNIDLTFDLNRIIKLAIGYQYLSQTSPSVPWQEFNRGISYFQVQAGF